MKCLQQFFWRTPPPGLTIPISELSLSAQRSPLASEVALSIHSKLQSIPSVLPEPFISNRLGVISEQPGGLTGSASLSHPQGCTLTPLTELRNKYDITQQYRLFESH